MTITNYAELARSFSTGKGMPSDVLEQYLSVIERREPDVNAFVCMDKALARKQAAEADVRWQNGTQLSPIDGMPFGVKDIIETANLPTGQGSPILEGSRTGRNSATVEALCEAGAIVLGKTTTTEFASTELFAKTTNAHSSTHTPGGSSSGSAAAVGAGMIPLALASQVVGSTLRPASYNGAIGYKPTVGGLNRGGSFDYLSQSCVGLIGIALEDVWLAVRAIASRAGGDPGHVGVLGPDRLPAATRPGRVAFIETDGWAIASSDARDAMEAELDRMCTAGIDIATRQSCAVIEGLEQAIAGALDLVWEILVWEMRWPLNTLVRCDVTEKISKAMKCRLSQGEAMNQSDYARALSRRQTARTQMINVSRAYDAVITLGATGAAPTGFKTTGDPSFNVPASLLGAPALSIPVLQNEGMPLGLQILSGQGGDVGLFGHAHWLLQRDRA